MKLIVTRFLKDHFYAVTASPARGAHDVERLAEAFAAAAKERNVDLMFTTRWRHLENVKFMYVPEDVAFDTMQDIADAVHQKTKYDVFVSPVKDDDGMPYYFYMRNDVDQAVRQAAVLSSKP